MGELLWYIPNTVEAGIRGDDVASGWADLERSVTLARVAEDHGWGGALLGTSWGRPDTFTVATALAARTTTFKPLIAVRPGYWQPAHFASAAATLDHLTGGRVLVNIVSGQDNLAAYGDHEADRGARYARTREFMRIVRLLWTAENVTYRGEHFGVEESTVTPRPYGRLGITHFIISDAPYLRECARIGDEILPRLRAASPASTGAGGPPRSPGSG